LKVFIASAFRDTWSSVRPEAGIFMGLAARGHEVTIATRGHPGYCQRFREAGIRILDAYPGRKLCLSTIRAYRRELKTGGYDIAYGMNSKTIPNLAFAAIGVPVKLVTYRGSSSGLYRHDPTSYLTHLHPRVDAICCASRAVERVVRSRVWRRSLVIATVYKGQDLSWFSGTPADLSEFGIPDSAFLIVCVANARPVKGIEVLLEASDAVLDHPDVHLLIVGRGVCGAPYVSIRDKKPARSRIHLVEHRSNVLGLIAAASIYVQPSLNEGLPKAVVEAMAQSVPAIVTDAGGMPELVVDGETGWVVRKGSAEAMSEGLVAAYQMRGKLADMGQRARARIAREFSLEASIEAHIRLFESLLGGGAASRAARPR
jgi:glycosyltransferase involved in cell wall biosynthesis